MKPGDLISFKPFYSHADDWSNPVLIIKKFATTKDGHDLWLGWCDGYEVYVCEADHDIAHIKKDKKVVDSPSK